MKTINQITLARRLGCSEKTIYRWRQKYKLPFVRQVQTGKVIYERDATLARIAKVWPRALDLWMRVFDK